jgi:hypothetical protein
MTVFEHFFERLFSYFRYAILNILSFTTAFSQKGYLGDGKLVFPVHKSQNEYKTRKW